MRIKKSISQYFKNSFFDKLIRNKLLPSIICVYLHFVHKTSKVKIIGKDYYSELKSQNENVVFSVWHGRQFSALYIHKNKGITVLVSPSRDGNVQAGFLNKFGFKTIRGSSDRNPVKSLISMIKTARKEKCDFAFAVDGPTGPIYKVKQGVTGFALKTGYKILPIVSTAKFKLILKTWDKCLIPLPFNSIKIKYGTPISITENCNIESETLKLEQIMLEDMKTI
ncbi:MAG TPA: lysophospholipid acyltransferase family protein [bacterium]|nr:lysophospholipid acyltransferase family protein [bacterium]HPN32818.1 lysophospholipid acyltransferase family protein [bacterium]